MECMQCGTSFVFRDSTSNAVSYGDDLAYSSFAYRRDNHFNEWVSSTMAKQSAPVPDDILETVCESLHRDRIRPDQITARLVRDVLKEKRLRKYYECSMKIACTLTGRDPPRMTPAEENRLRQRFRQIQAPFEVRSYVCARVCTTHQQLSL